MADERTRLRQLKDRFDVAHQRGMDALKVGNYTALGDAIKEERAIITEHKEVLDRVQKRTAGREPSRDASSLRRRRGRTAISE